MSQQEWHHDMPALTGPYATRALSDAALVSLCARVEKLAHGSIAGLTICNLARTHIERAIFPRLPLFAAKIVDIPLSPQNFGSCVQAIARGDIITASDIEKEERFDPQWKRLCLEHDIRAVQSRPFSLSDGRPYGTFVLTYKEPRAESDWDVALMKFAADASGTILQSSLEHAATAAE